MSTTTPTPAESPGAGRPGKQRPPALVRLRWALWAVALAAGLGGGAAVAVVHRSHPAATPVAVKSAPIGTWAAGVRRAPDFALDGIDGKPVTLSALRGRPVILTFLDPLCTDFCPREASILSAAVGSFPKQEPAILAVSVNPWGNAPKTLRADMTHWGVAPGWQWGVATHARLAAVWRSYDVPVKIDTSVIDGKTDHQIVHGGVTYLIDRAGYERALFVYPFTTDDVVGALRAMLAE